MLQCIFDDALEDFGLEAHVDETGPGKLHAGEGVIAAQFLDQHRCNLTRFTANLAGNDHCGVAGNVPMMRIARRLGDYLRCVDRFRKPPLFLQGGDCPCGRAAKVFERLHRLDRLHVRRP